MILLRITMHEQCLAKQARKRFSFRHQICVSAVSTNHEISPFLKGYAMAPRLRILDMYLSVSANTVVGTVLKQNGTRHNSPKIMDAAERCTVEPAAHANFVVHAVQAVPSR
jgi:hypothetical protein